MTPVIALTPSWDADRNRLSIPHDYICAVMDAGGAPIVIPHIQDETLACAALDRADALLLTGGDDVDPACYGEEKLPCCGELTPMRDRLEFILIRHAINKGLPILGICRGMQILNVVLGGTLYQDIAQQYGGSLRHPRSDIPAGDAHGMRYVEGSLLRSVTGLEESPVNSRHHQAVKALAPGMRASAFAPDGLTEGMEAADGRPILAVQWHPESIYRRLEEQANLFRWLVKEANK